MSLREIVAEYTIAVDSAPLTEADKKIERLNSKIKSFATIAGTIASAAAYLGYSWVEAASSVEEKMNVLTTTFGENSKGVMKWAEDHGKAIHRSRYDLQAYAADFGSFLEPKKFDPSQLEAMSTTMAGLAVDLASFYETSDQDAARSLLSGLSGETEAVRRFGIDISDERLSQLNKEKNGEKSIYKFLDLKAKTELRYQAFLRDTVAKQGDAKKTADSWANATKELRGEWKDFQIEMGKYLMPTAKKLLAAITKGFKDIRPYLEEIITSTHVFSTALAAAVEHTARMGVLWAIFNPAKMVQFAIAAKGAAAALAKFLVIEDIIGFLSGNNSVIGGIITELTGIARPLQYLMRVFEEFGDRVTNVFIRLGNLPRAIREAGSWDLFQANLNAGTVDIASKQQMDIQARETRFSEAVKKGDINAAIQNARDDESSRDATRRFLTDRRAYIRQSPEAATAKDVKEGFASRAGVPGSEWTGRMGGMVKPATPGIPASLLPPPPGMVLPAKPLGGPPSMPTQTNRENQPRNQTLKLEVSVTGDVKPDNRLVGEKIAEEMMKFLRQSVPFIEGGFLGDNYTTAGQ